MKAYWNEEEQKIVVDGEGDEFVFIELQSRQSMAKWVTSNIAIRNFEFANKSSTVEYKPADKVWQEFYNDGIRWLWCEEGDQVLVKSPSCFTIGIDKCMFGPTINCTTICSRLEAHGYIS